MGRVAQDAPRRDPAHEACVGFERHATCRSAARAGAKGFAGKGRREAQGDPRLRAHAFRPLSAAAAAAAAAAAIPQARCPRAATPSARLRNLGRAHALCIASLPCDRYAHPSQYGQQYDGYTSYPPQQPYGHSYDQAAGYEGGPSGAYDPAYGQQPAYVSALPHERQHELLKSLQVGLDAQLRTRLSAPPCGDALRSNARPSRPLQLTRDFLRALPSVPHLLSHTTGFFVRLNMGSRYFHYVAAQIVRIVGDELQVRPNRTRAYVDGRANPTRRHAPTTPPRPPLSTLRSSSSPSAPTSSSTPLPLPPPPPLR